MNRTIRIFFGISIILLIFACKPPEYNSEEASDTFASTLSDAKYLQQLLPALDASLALLAVDGPSESVFPGTPPGLPDTPEEMYADYFVPELGYARFPSENGYVDDLYDEIGNSSYIELKETTDGWGEYQVTIYIYPTLSPAIWYEVEQYRINGGEAPDGWYTIVGEDGASDPTAFELLTTYYFDGRWENREVAWSRWVSDERYDTAYFAIPESFDDPAYDYPDTIVPPTKVAVTDINDYAAEVHSVINYPKWDITGENVEFYNEWISGGVNKYSKAFTSEKMEWGNHSHEKRTVRIYTIDPDGNKTVRAKTINIFSKGGERTETEAIDITVVGDTTSYSSIVGVVLNENSSYEVSMDLEETSENVFEGTLTSGESTVVVSLDALNGLEMTQGGRKLKYQVHNVNHFGFTHSTQKVTFESDDGDFEGEYESGQLDGDYTPKKGNKTKMMVGKSAVGIGSVVR